MTKIKECENMAQEKLRRHAESSVGPPPPEGADDLKRLLHELEVRQCALEMQNEELQAAYSRIAELNEQYVSLYDHAPCGYLCLDREGIVRGANLTAARQLDIERERLLGAVAYPYVHHDDRDVLSSHLRAVFEGNTPERPVVRLAKGTEYFLAELHSILTADSEGPVCRTSIIDIDHRSLLGDMRRQADLMELIPDAVILSDLEGSVIYWGGGAEAMYGWNAENACGCILNELFGSNFCTASQDMLLTSGRWEGELLRTCSDGRTINVHVRRLLRRDAEGNPEAVLETSTDITERKRMEGELLRSHAQLEKRVEERTQELSAAVGELKTVMDAVPAAVWIADRESMEVIGNRYSYRLLGLPEGTVKMSGCKGPGDYRTLRDGVEVPPEQLPIYRAAAEGVEIRDCELDIVLDDGSSRTIYGNASPLLDETGASRGAVGAFVDITERKQMERDLRIASMVAENANKAKSEFLANMSHELRTPITGILGFTDLCLETKLSDDQRAYLAYIKSSGDKLLEIVNDILDISRIESGKIELNRLPFSLRETVNAALVPLLPSIEKKGLRFSFHVDPAIPDNLSGDPERLRQAIGNLAGNAVKFTESGEIGIDVGMDSCTENKVSLHVAVRDSGIGIPADKLQLIFDSFTQADPSTSRSFGGTGLGLAIVTRIAELCKGHTWAESEPGKGSTFHLVVSLDVRTAEAPHSPSATLGAEGTPAGRLLSILLVDDDQVGRLAARKLLELHGHEVAEAPGGREALQLCEKRTFDLVLMDIQMKGMDGFAATAEIRAREQGTGRRLPVFALTAHAFSGYKEKCLAAGMDGYVSKPLSREKIYLEYENWLVRQTPAQ